MYAVTLGAIEGFVPVIVEHPLNTRDVLVQACYLPTGVVVQVDVLIVDDSHVQVSITHDAQPDEYRVLLIGGVADL